MDALPDFKVLNPTTLDEVLAARAAHPDSKPLGGGTDLVVNIRRGIVAPPVLIDVREPWEFDVVRIPGAKLVPMRAIPARYAELQRDAETALMREAHDELERLRTVVAALQFDPLPGGIVTRDQALYVLGFPPGSIPDQGALRTRFRRLATVYHPDGKDGSHLRMSQLNAAMEMLRRGGL